MKLLFAVLGAVFALAAFAGDVTVTSVTAQQRYPWNGLVDITVTLQGAAEDVAEAECSFTATNGVTNAAIPITHISQNGGDAGSGNVWTRKFIWDARADIGAVKINDVALTVDIEPPYVQLWENGPYWAKCNVGATKPEEAGYYFWWGDAVGYKRNANNDGWISTKDSTSCLIDDCPTFNKDISQLQAAGYIDATGNLVAAHDAATVHLGAPWRIPTGDEMEALVDNCTTTWTTRNGVVGRLVTGKGFYAAKSIFLPAAGLGLDSNLYCLGLNGGYWSSTPAPDEPDFGAWCLFFGSDDFCRQGPSRFLGWSVRPVREFAETPCCTVTFNANGGSCSIVSKVCPYGGAIGDLPMATRDGYCFDGWYTASSGGTKVASSTTVTGNLPLYAHWTKDEDSDSDGVQLWENGPYWAKCNVGAAKPEEAGYYFWWGDTVGYKRDSRNRRWISVKDSAEFSFDSGTCPIYGKDNSQLQLAGYIDSKGNLVAAHDAATAHLGAPWRMPTGDEIQALVDNCTTEWTTRNGASGRLVTGKGSYASRSIFLPAADSGCGSDPADLGWCGCYWSSTPNSDNSYDARCLNFGSVDFHGCYSILRYCGLSVRPVKEYARYHTVTLNANGGSCSMASTVCPYGGTIGDLPTATRDGHCFVGWYTAPSGGTKVTSFTIMTDNLTLYAHWVGCSEGVQLWEDGPYWAECNVGATKPEESGYYFWWGDTVGYKRNANDNGWISVKDLTEFSFCSDSCPTYGDVNYYLHAAGYVDAAGNLVAAHDAAAAHLGEQWRMPTDAEFLALINNCDTAWTMRNGVYGRLVTGRGAYASKSIFFPAVGIGDGFDLNSFGSHGDYWSSTPDSFYANLSRTLRFSSSDFYWNFGRCYLGLTVRPVKAFACYYTLTFDANGGSCSTVSKAYPCGVDMADLPTATRDRYYFDGWYTALSGGTKVLSSTVVTNNLTLYAHWVSCSDGVQLWEDGPYWAECNVGANQPEDYGYYFWWGDTVGYKRNGTNDGWISVKDSSGFLFDEWHCHTYDKDYSQLQSMGYIDVTGKLIAAHDAARAHLGAPWRMPTDAEFSALISNCDTAWTMRNGVYGRLVTGKGAYASRSIFLPAAGFGDGSLLCNFASYGYYGYYWSSTSILDDSFIAWSLAFAWDAFCRYRISGRLYGHPVRPVRGVAETPCYTVTFNANGGSCSTVSKVYPYGVVIGDLPMATRDGYCFDGWYTALSGGTEVASSMIVTGVLTIYAHWTKDEDSDSDGVQLWKNGPYWAKCNVGATKPEEAGYYFWWGDTVGYKRMANIDTWFSIKDSTAFSFNYRDCPTWDKDKSQLQLAGYIDATENLVAAHDSARACLGAPWRMPTGDEIQALVDNCTTEWTTRNGVFGRLVAGKGAYAARSIFLPAASFGYTHGLDGVGSDGHYWASTPTPGDSLTARTLNFSSGDFHLGYETRFFGLPVRPVKGFAK